MTLGAKELTGRGRACPAMSVAAGDFSLKVGQNPGLTVCAEAGESQRASKTLTLVPPSATLGTINYLLVGVQDGGQYIYRYRAGAVTPPKCRKPSMFRTPSESQRSGDEPKCEYTIIYKFRVVDKAGRVAHGFGKLSGTSLNDLEPVDSASDTENLIYWKDGDRSIVLDVSSGLYRNRGRLESLTFAVSVFRSNASL